jgi:hypothetical protein
MKLFAAGTQQNAPVLLRAAKSWLSVSKNMCNAS